MQIKWEGLTIVVLLFKKNYSIVEYLMFFSNCESSLSTEPAQSEAEGLERDGKTQIRWPYMSKHMEII